MNRNDIINMAIQAEMGFDLTIPTFIAELERFANLVASAERRACIETCQNLVMYGLVAESQQRYNQAYWHCIDAIRTNRGSNYE